MGFFKWFTRPRAKLWLTTEKHELALGEELKGIVEVKSEEEFDIEGIIVSLSCWESIKKTRRYYKTDDMTNEKEWHEEEYWDQKALFSESAQVCGTMHVNIGFDKDFPFVFKIAASGRETYHSVDKNVQWLISATMNIKERRHIKTPTYEILVAKSSVLMKEIVREVVLIPCSYCGGLMPQTSLFCPNCGARRK